MKKKLILGLTILSMTFLLGGLYITVTIQRATTTLNDLIKLHKVEILREHLLVQLKGVQSDLSLHNTRHAKGVDSLVGHVKNMGTIVDTCFDCHHSEDINLTLVDLQQGIQQYKYALSNVFTINANLPRLEAAEDRAFRMGENLSTKVNTMIKVAKVRLDQKTESALHEIEKTKTILYILVATGSVLTIALALLIIRGFTKPVNRLLEATQKLEEGDLDHRVEGLKDEFGVVAASFNNMAGSLKKQMERIQRAEQMAVCGELTTRLAHEIKNPLAGIKLAMEVLSEETTMTEEDKKILRKVVYEVQRIESLIKSLLSFSRPPKPQLTNVNLNAILDRTVNLLPKNSLYSAVQSKSIEVVKDFKRDPLEIMADPMQLQQIFLNLCLNALDAMSEGGILRVRTLYDPASESIEVAISDTGKGIKEDLLDRLFIPFITTKPKGTGLGLTITKQLVEQHGGTIEVTNNRNSGATFFVRFPVDKSTQERLIP